MYYTTGKFGVKTAVTQEYKREVLPRAHSSVSSYHSDTKATLFNSSHFEKPPGWDARQELIKKTTELFGLMNTCRRDNLMEIFIKLLPRVIQLKGENYAQMKVMLEQIFFSVQINLESIKLISNEFKTLEGKKGNVKDFAEFLDKTVALIGLKMSLAKDLHERAPKSPLSPIFQT
ncbi:hypothetical protein BH10PSE19_BH10PSE19_15820 [soil metagenome]